MHSNAQSQSYQETAIPQCPKYVEALLKCPERKVCTNLANSINTTHDVVYKEMKDISQNSDITKKDIQNIAVEHLNKDNTYLVLDDVKLSKMYSKEIEGTEVGYDGSTKQTVLGLNMVTSLLTDRVHCIPMEAIEYVGKALSGAYHKTKSAIAKTITKCIREVFIIKRILADAHFSTREMLSFLHEEQISYLMKVSRNRIVTINGVTGQLQNLLRLKKNSHTACAQGSIFGIPCWFYVVKIKDGSTIYLISNDQIDMREVLSLYRIRWKIEVFHRTGKQSFGMRDCQMLAIEKQRQHVLFVMHAYAIAECIRVKNGLKNVEEVVKCYRS
jgi:Transposase DDE domain